jgi:hypothetical protein
MVSNIYRRIRIDDSRHLSNILNESNKLYSIDSDNGESENIEGQNPFDYNFIFEDTNRENGPNNINNISMMNSFNNNNNVEHNNISSMNTTNENKVLDFISKIPVLPDCFIDLSNKKQIFDIKKVNKRLGRLKKNSSIPGKHSKLAEDNIIRKIKRRFLENLRVYVNKEYKNYRIDINKATNRKNWLKKINPKLSRTIKKNDNLKWFDSKVYEVFSDNLSVKYTSQNLNSNKRKIQNLLSISESNKLKDILNSTIDTLYTRYITNQSFDEFKTLNDDLNDLAKLMKKNGQENINEYLCEYERIAIDLKTIFMNKIERKRRKK